MRSGGRKQMLALAVLLASQWLGCTNSDDSQMMGPVEDSVPVSKDVVLLGDGVWAEQVDGSDEFVLFEARFQIQGESGTYSYDELLTRESQGFLPGDTRIDMLVFRSEGGASKGESEGATDLSCRKNLNEPPVIETCWTCIKLCRAEPDCVRQCTKERCG